MVTLHASMRPVEFGEALTPGSRLTLFSNEEPDRFFTIIGLDWLSFLARALLLPGPRAQRPGVLS